MSILANVIAPFSSLSSGEGFFPLESAAESAERERRAVEAGTGPLVQVKDLTVSFPREKGRAQVISHMSFEIGRGEIVGVVGESGSGKSMTALSIMGLLPKDASVDSGQILFNGRDLLTIDPVVRRTLMGSEMGMVFQEPMTSLNPVMRIEDQVEENLVLHTGLSGAERHERVIEALKAVGLTNAEATCKKYPHELSGGQRQRVMLALAAICRPHLIIADEPTTALDVVVQEQILRLLVRFNREMGLSILFISHDLNVVKRLCERVIVVYKGEIVEQGKTLDVMEHPQHEYTKHLVSEIPERPDHGTNTDTVLSLSHLDVYYDVREGLFRPKGKKHVIHDFSFNVHEGEILGIVGESGCGKSTLSKVILGLHKNYTGEIKLRDGIRPQMVFQDPFSSLNPARTIGWILEEPLKVRGIASASERRRMVEEMLTDVGLDPSYMTRRPRELSGGQRQRISIGTALLMNSGFIIADEPVSALDVTVQSQIINLLVKLHEERHMTLMFISHDMNMVRRICRRVVVIYRGEIVEAGRSEDLYAKPAHPYTRMLLAATHAASLDEAEAMDALPTKVPDDYPGCPFALRCEARRPMCSQKKPGLVDMGRSHVVRCFHPHTGKES